QLQVNELPALQNGFVTFGCLNNFCKVNNQVLSLWARVLQVVPDSRLILLAPPGQAWQQTLAELGRDGVQPERVKFFPIQPAAEYLKSYLNIDFGLDTFPYNGHTTSLDGLWMGVPTVTLIGNTVVGRAGFSQLSNLGLTELAARSPEQFVEIAVKLAGDIPRLQELRRTMRQRMQASPLMDAKRFARNVEAAYRNVWKKWANGSPTQ
ncbi:MAG TPA: hypothetical protein VKJ65_04040, partial [Phycisphaerae bacterium]|nr:hypothetical protein [Phycisphaerae bacterium]